MVALNLNPSKTLPTKILPIINPNFPAASTSTTRMTFKSNKFQPISASLQKQQQPSLADALLNSPRKHQVLDAIRTQHSLSICLSETNLHLTVPGLKSKIPGKVYYYLNACFLLGLIILVTHLLGIEK